MAAVVTAFTVRHVDPATGTFCGERCRSERAVTEPVAQDPSVEMTGHGTICGGLGGCRCLVQSTGPDGVRTQSYGSSRTSAPVYGDRSCPITYDYADVSDVVRAATKEDQRSRLERIVRYQVGRCLVVLGHSEKPATL